LAESASFVNDFLQESEMDPFDVVQADLVGTPAISWAVRVEE
jgi:hypothetical protein